jgi:hypothetical protein
MRPAQRPLFGLRFVFSLFRVFAIAFLLMCLLACPLESPAGEIVPAQSRLGINLAGPSDWNTELPFVDVFRLARHWISQRKGEPWGKGPKLELDANGWVKRLEPDCWAETLLCTIEGGHYPTGQYVCLYEGDGQIDFGSAREVSRGPGRIVFEPGGQGAFFLRIRQTNPENHVRNIRVIMPGFEKTCRDNPWHPAFLARWRQFNTFRFMDWMLTNGSKVRRWADRPMPEYFTCTERGVPLELMIGLCNRLGVNPWFCMPHEADDDYVRQFAQQVKRELKPGLKVYIEYSNEIWNSIFQQTRYANDQGLKLGFGEKPWEAGWRYSAFRSVQMFAIWEEVFGGRERLVRVIASQAAVPYIAEQKLSFRDAFKHCDALGIAPYMSFNIPAKSDRGRSDRLDADTVSRWTVDQVLDHVENRSVPECIRWIQDNKKVADKYKVKLVAYEAGQHLVGVGGGENNEKLTKLLMAANRHPRMGQFYTRYLDAWRDADGDLCGIFSSVGRFSKWGSWGLLEYYDDDTPKFQAVLRWNGANPR